VQDGVFFAEAAGAMVDKGFPGAEKAFPIGGLAHFPAGAGGHMGNGAGKTKQKY
jgi:hypothetical protein